MSDMEKELAWLDALEKKATPGDWTLLDESHTIEILDGEGFQKRNAVVTWMGFDGSDKKLSEKKANARLIVALRNAYPKLRSALEAMRKEREEMQRRLDHLAGGGDAASQASGPVVPR